MKPMSIVRVMLMVIIAFVGITAFASPEMADFYSSLHIPTDWNTGVTMAASPLVIQFAKDIQDNIYPANEFYKQSVDDSVWIDGITVRLPQAGVAPNVVTNRTTLPATIAKRTDSAEEYNIDEHTTDPTLIQDTEEMIVSYQKRASVLMNHTETINTKVADNFAQIWSPTQSGNILRTSGPSISVTSPGATGNRKAIADADLIAAVTLLDRMDISAEERYMLIPASMYGQLLALDKFVNYQSRGLVDLVGKGFIGEIYGLKIYKRSRAALYDNTGTPVKKAIGAAAATTDNESVLIWHKSKVRRAEGGAKVYMNEAKAEYYGSIFSAKVNSGGRIARTDEKGVVTIVQTAV